MPRTPPSPEPPAPDRPPADEPTLPVGGLLAMEAADELALGDMEDYGTDEASLGLDEEGSPIFGLSFGSEREPTGAWDLSDIAELVVNETSRSYDAEGGSRDDVGIMEEFDDDDEVVVAVWEPDEPGGRMQVGARVRRRVASVPKQYIPYGLIAAGLGALLLIAVLGIGAVVLIGLVTGPNVVSQPLDPDSLPKVEIERKPIEHQSADEILEEVLGEDAE